MTTYPFYLLAIGVCDKNNIDFISGLRTYLNRKAGTNWKINSCSIQQDRIVETILSNLDKINGGTISNNTASYYSLLKLKIKFNESIDYRFLAWLEDEVKWYVSHNQEFYSAGYFFYPIFLKGKPSLRIFACCHTGISNKDEIDCGDDFTYILRLSSFLMRHLFFHDADTVYPEIVAALLLQFGDNSSSGRVTA